MIVSNQGAVAQRLDVGTAQAVTAQNSGSAFGQFSRQCAGVGCWVTGLPPVVTVGPGRTATWSGEVRLTAPANPVTVHTGGGVYSELPQDPVPWRAIALLVLGALILAALIAVIVRRRPRTPSSRPSRAE